MRQRTLKSPIRCNGVGLHSGAPVTMVLHPAPKDHGIVFYRTDVAGDAARIQARYDRVVNTVYCTMLGNDHGVTVSTTEHLLAALSGIGIDNVRIELDGPEVPVMDGSSAPFVFLIECGGWIEQTAPRRALKILREVRVEDRGRIASLSPAEDLTIGFEIEFDGMIGHQEYEFRLTPGAFKAELARARTFGFMHEVEQLRAAGLALGGSLDNSVVIENDTVLNADGLRYDDEFVRHKVLDCLGDLYLAGGPVLGRYYGERSGHAMTNKLLRAVFADAANYAWVDHRAPVLSPVAAHSPRNYQSALVAIGA